MGGSTSIGASVGECTDSPTSVGTGISLGEVGALVPVNSRRALGGCSAIWDRSDGTSVGTEPRRRVGTGGGPNSTVLGGGASVGECTDGPTSVGTGISLGEVGALVPVSARGWVETGGRNPNCDTSEGTSVGTPLRWPGTGGSISIDASVGEETI